MSSSAELGPRRDIRLTTAFRASEPSSSAASSRKDIKCAMKTGLSFSGPGLIDTESRLLSK